ncbi:BA14K family protein [Methylobacterium sp. Gmos1]
MKLPLVIAATVAAMVAGSPASATPAETAAGAALLRGDLPTEFSQYRRYGRPYGYRRGYGFRGGYGRGYGYRRGPVVGAAVGAGVAGLAAGAIIGGAIASSQAQARPVVVEGGPDPETVAACARRFRSYDPASGTYLSNDGTRRPCP